MYMQCGHKIQHRIVTVCFMIEHGLKNKYNQSLVVIYAETNKAKAKLLQTKKDMKLMGFIFAIVKILNALNFFLFTVKN